MSARDIVIYPFAFAIYPIAHLAARNQDWGIGISDLLAPVALALTVAGAAWLLARRKRAATATTGLLTLLIVIFLFWYGLYLEVLESTLRSSRLVTNAVALGTWSGLLVAGWAVIDRWRPSSRTVSTYLNLVSVLMLAFPLAGLLSDGSESPPTRPPTEMDDDGLTSTSPPEVRPDLFYLVLDGYSASRFLERNFAFDNSGFENALKRRGFVVPTRARANYVHTHLSLASMLNWTHLLFLENHGSGDDRSPTYRMIENNRAARYLKSLGYEFVFVPTTFPATNRNRLADRQIPAPSQNDPDLMIIWLAQTPLSSLSILGCRVLACDTHRWFPYPPESGEEIREKFRILGTLVGDGGPRFVLAHLLVPHPPYVLEADCSSRDPIWPPSGDPDAWPLVRESYTDQIRCLNTLLIELVDRIIDESGGSAIIVLQADHGSGRMQLDPLVNETIPVEELEEEQILERSGVFAAYYLPGANPRAIYDSITPVNIFPVILNQYFGENIPYREDRTYWSDYRDSYRFEEVDRILESKN